ncbi:MAG: efflux RND transporter periplasmic adaptor subunit [Stellaceae bacterium]
MDSSGRAGPGDIVIRPVPLRSRRMALWLLGMALLMALVLGLLYVFNSFRSHAIADFFAHNRPPPAIVAMTVAESQSVPHFLTGIGSIAAVHQVTVASQVGGAVTQILFTAGQNVPAGQPLVQIDDGPEQGDLRNFEAQQRYDAVTLKRNQELVAKQAVSQSTLDQSQSLLDQANAGIAKTKALIAQKLIRAPFAGKLGVRLIEVGQYVAPGTAMVSLTDLSQLYINFTLPEQTAAALTQGQEVEIGVDAYPGQSFKAKINAIEPQVTADTRTIKLQAVMDNPDGKLLPGMFANVHVVLPPRPDMITVPETAVENTLYGDSVYVVVPDGTDAKGQPALKAKRVRVTTGEHVGGRVAILGGVAAGDRVVALGQNKVLFDGAAVTPSGSEGLALPEKIPTN